MDSDSSSDIGLERCSVKQQYYLMIHLISHLLKYKVSSIW